MQSAVDMACWMETSASALALYRKPLAKQVSSVINAHKVRLPILSAHASVFHAFLASSFLWRVSPMDPMMRSRDQLLRSVHVQNGYSLCSLLQWCTP